MTDKWVDDDDEDRLIRETIHAALRKDSQMQFNYEAHSAKLELRIMELEDTVRALAGVAKTTADLVSNLTQVLNHYADALGGVMLAMPSVVHKMPMWPVAAHPFPPSPTSHGTDEEML